MEYCGRGDLQDAWNRVTRNRARPIAEEYLWRIFGCLARALMMMEHGSEALLPIGQAGWNTPICHFDIKPENSKSLRRITAGLRTSK
jgi:hypothetical protein